MPRNCSDQPDEMTREQDHNRVAGEARGDAVGYAPIEAVVAAYNTLDAIDRGQLDSQTGGHLTNALEHLDTIVLDAVRDGRLHADVDESVDPRAERGDHTDR